MDTTTTEDRTKEAGGVGPGVVERGPSGRDPGDTGPGHHGPGDPDAAGTRRWDDRGMATVEYAIASVAAAGLAGLLLVILRSDEVRGMLLEIVRSALAFG